MPSHQRKMATTILLMTCPLCKLIQIIFSQLLAFIGLIWSSTLEEMTSKGTPSILATYIALPLAWLVVGHWFTCLLISYISCCKVFTFHCSSQFVSKTEKLTLSNLFSLMWKLFIKATNITNMVHIIFNVWLGCFEYMLCLITLIILNVSISLLSNLTFIDSTFYINCETFFCLSFILKICCF